MYTGKIMAEPRVRAISKTVSLLPQYDMEGIIAYCARVSSVNQDNPDYYKLLKYCMDNKHWSVFEMADLTLEIVGSRAILRQILRHRSFCFQEFSQRYAKAKHGYHNVEARRQDEKNRQNSIDDMTTEDRTWFNTAQFQVYNLAMNHYNEALARGVAKEQARMLLPENTMSKMYMKGSLRSWITYLFVRLDESTQKEHRDIAELCSKCLIEQYPTIGKLALGEEE